MTIQLQLLLHIPYVAAKAFVSRSALAGVPVGIWCRALLAPLIDRRPRRGKASVDASRADGLPAVENLRRPPRRSLAARAVIVGWALAVLVALELVSLRPAAAQTVLTATDGASLVSALTTIDNNPNTSYTLNITQNITLTS